MINLNQFSLTKYLKYYLLVFVISLTSITGFATTSTVVENTFENTETLKKAPPTLVLAKPSQKRMTTLKNRETIKAYVKNIKRKRRIVVRINGKRTRKFKFRKNSGLVKIKAKLDEGENLIEIVAKNRRGEVSEALSITRELPAGPPSVEVIRPSDRFRTYEEIVLVTAKMQNIEHRDDIVILVDGLERDFIYHASSGMLRADINVEMGSNHIVINAYNRNGEKASDEIWVLRQKRYTPTYTPIISIAAPTQQPFYTQEQSYLIKASVRHIQDADQIVFTFNGQQSYDFTYNSSSREFMAYVELKEGSNIFRIQSNNEHGNEQASGTIIYQYQTITATIEEPIIEMITPTTHLTTSDEELYIKARIYNISDASDINFSANGMNCVDFSFEPNTGIFTSSQRLKNGYNCFIITASNESGETTHTVESTLENISYVPVVSLIHPNMQSTTTQANVSVKASVEHITRKNQITVKYNGQMVSNFILSGGTYKYIEFEATNLRNGKNYIDITVRNADGQDKVTAEVTYNKPIVRPVVSILSPTTNGQSANTQQKLTTVKAKVLNANKQQIKVLVNGKQKAFQMLGHMVVAKFDLKNGKNTIAIIANNGKTAQASIVVNYQAIQKPTVTLSNLKGNLVTKKKAFTVKGKVEHITNKSGIQILVNNEVFTQYSFNPYTGSLTFTAPLKNGKNYIEVKATNNSGQALNHSTVIYNDGVERVDGKK